MSCFWFFVLGSLISYLLVDLLFSRRKAKKDKQFFVLMAKHDKVWWQLIKAIEHYDCYDAVDTEFYRAEVARLARLRMHLHFQMVALRPSWADDKLVSSCHRLIRDMEKAK